MNSFGFIRNIEKNEKYFKNSWQTKSDKKYTKLKKLNKKALLAFKELNHQLFVEEDYQPQ